jgi:hypothetical protein
MEKHLIFYFIGIAIVFLTHASMLFKSPAMRTHALVNLFAAACIAYYFMHREGYIRF